jgi:hypothetical protein
MLWTKEKTLSLIEKTRESGVWNVKLKEYWNHTLKHDIYLSIGNDFGITKKEIEYTWHNVKSQFSRELAKVNASLKSGAGTEDIDRPTWYSFSKFHNLKFLTFKLDNSYN